MFRPTAIVMGLALVAGAARAQDSSAAALDAGRSEVRPAVAPAPSILWTAADTVRRHHAIQFSDGYYRRLKIHRIGSYTMLPLFVGEYVLGQRLLNRQDIPRGVKAVHLVGAVALGGLFTVNTVTGLWNLKESWHEPSGRGVRLLHSALMLASDAGFFYTTTLAKGAGSDPGRARQHRNAGLVSMSLATAGTLLMWIVNR